MKLISIICFNLAVTFSYGQTLLNYKPAMLESKEQKNRLVLITTNWCKFCELFKQTTLAESEIINQLNEEFIYVPFNAESEQTITLNGTAYSKKLNEYHEFAKILGSINDKLAFPTIVLLNPNNDIIFQHQGYLSSEELLPVLQQSNSQ